MPRRIGVTLAAGGAVVAAMLLVGSFSVGATAGAQRKTSPIQHVVVIYQENHSFDNVLGAVCAQRQPTHCDGATTGVLPDGQTIQLSRATDLIPAVDHTTTGQATAIDQGAMDGFGANVGCTQTDAYACYSQFQQDQIPNLWSLANTFTVADRTFELNTVPSFGAHLELVTTTLDGFTGDNTVLGKNHKKGPGWGCDSFKDAPWRDPHNGKVLSVPSCVPDASGRGPYRRSPVQYVPTLMDRMDAAGVTWKFYVSLSPDPSSGYNWAICPTFAGCRYSSQFANVVETSNVLQDAAAGTLPNFSIVLPNGATGRTSQHNGTSMIAGDNWVGNVVQAIEDGPDWSSTAIFITYDDCGCFYDHVPPPAGLGIRVPMVIVSPYAVPGGTDSNVASFASLLAFTEHTYGLSALTSVDATAYDYAGAFDFSQEPRRGIQMVRSPVPAWERAWVASHPQNDAT
jgi:phospholipase C